MHHRRSDTAEYVEIIERDFAKVRAELAALTCAVSALTRENANLKHENYAKDQVIAELRRTITEKI